MQELDVSTSSAPFSTSGFASIAGSIHPTTSKLTNRYFKSSKYVDYDAGDGLPINLSITYPEPDYLPPQWSAHIHPEGQPYFLKNAAIRVVTEAYVYDGNVLEKVEYWIEVIENLVSQKQTLSDGIELFVQIDGNDCLYYLVDHDSRTEFWLDDLETSEMGFEPVASTTHLTADNQVEGVALEELYWIHVEYFPTHLERLVPRDLEELIGVFSHAWAGTSIPDFPSEIIS
ncbi:hypothetical protein C0993_007092 [Termitomyces sp. T159_Od127]|nr:hypothetical protein C0993_007092 [Termitomyces sp. T159_Od127]